MSIDPKTLPVLKPGSRGPAVKAAKMGVHAWNAKPGNTTALYGPFFKPLVKQFQTAHNLTADGVIGPATWKALLPHLNATAKALLEPPMSILLLCNPIPRSASRYSLCQGLHETGGLDGNWAIDLCVDPNTPVLACEAGTVTKLSGRSPKQDVWDTQGVFGWTVYFTTPAGYRYFVTHLGSKSVKVGDKVVAGTKIGAVGDQAFRPDHTHYGVTSPKGEGDAKARILAVSKAPRV
jgi:murein DD-endopeptidase MepM/ murein hydrolase activator NlpD